MEAEWVNLPYFIIICKITRCLSKDRYIERDELPNAVYFNHNIVYCYYQQISKAESRNVECRVPSLHLCALFPYTNATIAWVSTKFYSTTNLAKSGIVIDWIWFISARFRSRVANALNYSYYLFINDRHCGIAIDFRSAGFCILAVPSSILRKKYSRIRVISFFYFVTKRTFFFYGLQKALNLFVCYFSKAKY